MVIMTNSPSRPVWGVAEAKARFSEVLERAKSDGPQHITRKGRDAAIVVAADEWRSRRADPKPPLGVGSLLAFWQATPFWASEVEFPRISGAFKKPVFDEDEL